MTTFIKYHNLLCVPALIVIFVSFLSGFGSLNDEEIVKSLLIERTTVLQDGYFGSVSIEDTEKNLASFETYPVLKEDIENLRNNQETDFNRVIRMRFKDIEKKHEFMGYIVYETSILWDMRGPDGNYETEGKYHTVIRNAGSENFLSKFVLI